MSSVKKFLIAMAVIFGGLAIYFLISSIRTVEGLDFQIVNIQDTVFFGVFAVICAINIVGALIYSLIEKAHNIQPEPKEPVLFCYNCGIRTKEEDLTTVRIKTRKGIQEKGFCKKCLVLPDVKKKIVE